MSDIDIPPLTSWLVARGLAGALETDLMQGFCTECRRDGLQLSRAMAFIDTPHPVHQGRAFRWRNDGHEESPVVEYGRTNEREAAARWQGTPCYRLVTTSESELRRRLARGKPTDFTMIEELKAAGQTDYLAFTHRFAADGAGAQAVVPTLTPSPPVRSMLRRPQAARHRSHGCP